MSAQLDHYYCDSCTNAAEDEAGFTPEPLALHLMLGEMGADIADHFCDGWESGRSCYCACRRR